MNRSPYVHGGPVAPSDFLNRNRELRRLLNRLEKGQATAIVGQPHTGKTSLLRYVTDKVKRDRIVGSKLDRCWFRELDSHMLGRNFDQPAFWEHVLEPLKVYFDGGPIHDLYKQCQDGDFDNFCLKRLFAAMDKEDWRIVVLLDEFDALLNHPILNSAEFYGSLRSLSSRYTSLALVIGTRRTLNQLNIQTQEINPHSSPYFNIFTELRLGPLPKRDAAKLLAMAGSRFDEKDRQFIILASGRHPFLLQMAADIMWEADLEGKKGIARYEAVAEEFRAQSEKHFADTWRTWSEAECKVIMAIALSQMTILMEDRYFDWAALIENIKDYSPELRGLEKSGTIFQESKNTWRISQRALLWWLADEIKRLVRDESSLEGWLEDQEIEGILTQEEKRTLGQVLIEVGEFLGHGAMSLIGAFARGVGEGLGESTMRF